MAALAPRQSAGGVTPEPTAGRRPQHARRVRSPNRPAWAKLNALGAGVIRVVETGTLGYRRGLMNRSDPAIPDRDELRPRRWWPLAAAVLSGGLLTLCFAPWNQAWLCWLALTPLTAAVWSLRGDAVMESVPVTKGRMVLWMRRLAGKRWARGFALGYVAGLVFFWGAFYWLTQVTGIGWFILPFYMGLYFAAWGAFMATVARPGEGKPAENPARRLSAAQSIFRTPEPASSSTLLRSRWNLWHAFLGAAAWTGLEWVRGWMFTGFGWNDLGVALHENVAFLQITAWTGVGGLSFLAAFVNIIALATVLRFTLEVRAHRIRPHFDFTLTVTLMLAVFSYGIHQVRSAAREAALPGATVPLRVAAVQAGIPQNQKWNRALEASIHDQYRRLSGAAIATHPQLLLWPEAATTYGMFDASGDTKEFVDGIAEQAGCNLLLGTLDFDFGADGRAQADYNAAMMRATGDKRYQIYRKMHLVPFGEFVPFRHSFPLFAWIVGSQVPGDFEAGKEPGVFLTNEPGVRLGPLICFEDTVGRVARQPVRLGAQLLVNLTNDGWFGHTAANQQQLAESVFRAVENRRPLVRCANTGVTAFVDANGRVTQILREPSTGSVFPAGVLAGEVKVPANPALTFYTRYGEVFSGACFAATGMLAFLRLWRNLRGVELRQRELRRAEVTADSKVPVGS